VGVRRSYSVDDIARLLKLTPRRVQQLTAEGMIPKEERGRYRLEPAVHGYIDFLRGKLGSEGRAADSFSTQRARLYQARADIAEVERARLAGDLLPADEIEAPWVDMIAIVKTGLLAIPAKMAPRLAVILRCNIPF